MRRTRHIYCFLALITILIGVAQSVMAEEIQLVYASPATQPKIWSRGEKTVLERFMKEYPSIKVVPRRIPYESYDTQIFLSAKGGHPPDVARVNHSTIRKWAGAGYLMALDTFVAKSKIVDADDYYKGIWEACKVDGKLYSLPLGADCRAMLYNLKLFKQHNLSPPTTWDEFVATAKKIQNRKKKIYGWACPTSTEWNATYDAVGDFLVANGGHILNREGTKSVLKEDEAAQEAFRFACELATYHKICPPGIANLTQEVIDALMVRNRLAMMFIGPWARLNLKRVNPDFEFQKDYRFALLPKAPATGQTGSSQGGWLVGVFKETEHPQAVLKLLEFISRPESLATIAAQENLPPRRAARNLGPFRDPYFAIFFKQLPYARPPVTVVPQLNNVARAIQRAYQRVVAGGYSVEETIDWLHNEIDNHLLE
jgi:multiple sugar transport system substrate-binding protein